MSSTQGTTSRRGIGDILSIGFGTASAMWALGYFAHLPGASLPSPLVFALLMLALLGGGFFAGRYSPRGIMGGVWSGVVAALVNTLILGSVLGGGEGEFGSMMRLAPLWLLGSAVLSAVLGAAGAAFGSRRARPLPPERWGFIFSAVAAAATLLLLLAGGLVTSHRAGMAVPDWPSTYGSNMFLYPLSKMTGGIYLEHAHRLLGTLVGLIALVLAFYIQRAERRGFVKALAWLTLLAVIVQGIFGGVRVTENEIVLAIVHGVLGQGVFALFMALATVTSPVWDSSPSVSDRAQADRRLAGILLCAVIVQVALGSLLRHIDFSWHVHATVGTAVLVMAMIAGIRIAANHEEAPALVKAAKALMHSVGLQFILGFITLVPHLQVASAGMLKSPLPGEPEHVLPLAYILLSTAHQIIGALIFALSTRLVFLTRRLAQPPSTQPAVS